MAQDYECSDKMFRLGWLEDAVAEACLSNLAKIADSLKGQGAYGSDTIAIFVEPLLRGLGWETLNHNEGDRAPSGNHPDPEIGSISAPRTRKWSTQRSRRGLNSGTISRVCGSIEATSLPLCRLQTTHAYARLSEAEEPPCLRLRMWSTWCGKPASSS